MARVILFNQRGSNWLWVCEGYPIYAHYVLPCSFFIQEHGCFKKFSGQGVEKNNDDAKKILFKISNKWVASKDILFLENRQWDLQKIKLPILRKTVSTGM